MFFMLAQELSMSIVRTQLKVSVVLVLQVLYIHSERDSIECASLMQFVLMLSLSFCHLSRHDSSHYARTHYFQNQFKGLIKPTPGRASPPTTHHGMLNHGSQETWRSETFLQVSNKQMGKIHIFINVFMNNKFLIIYYMILMIWYDMYIYDWEHLLYSLLVVTLKQQLFQSYYK